MSSLFRKFFCLFGIMLFLGGCEAAGKIIEVIKDPDVPVGDADEQPSNVSLHAYAAGDVNRNFDGKPAPIIVKIFALSSTHRFYSYDFFSLAEEPENTLGITLLEMMGEDMLEPDAYKILGPYELPKGTQEIAVIAEYLDLEGATWRANYKVSDIGADDRLLMLLLEEEVRIINENE
ncbi:type VI secretion system lipoprotein TssJ [Halocynthiibacter namhaensis]|uniref:type VI secretion system lipoprotein TssJ n=1 Tax=Halocynthiibacter namhaensis TaxID=1290553 RepID=UPI0009DEEA8E|nr:type VI secretion system lipoprotein TssJ [Halocynthiibacter namhaensis]